MKISQPAQLLPYLPLYMALENEHEVITYDGPREAIEATIKKQADISMGEPFLFNYMDYEKENIVICGAFISKVLHSVITFDPFIQDKNKLNGKVAVAYPEPSTSFFLSQQLKKELKIGAVIETPFNTELGPLLTQEGDIAIIIEPNTTYALRNGARELIEFSSSSGVFTGFCTTRSTYAKMKENIKKLFAQLKEAIALFYQDEKKTLESAVKFFPLIEISILQEAIAKLRSIRPYCEDFKFSAEEIKEGLKLRQVDMPLQKIKKYLL